MLIRLKELRKAWPGGEAGVWWQLCDHQALSFYRDECRFWVPGIPLSTVQQSSGCWPVLPGSVDWGMNKLSLSWIISSSKAEYN